MENQAKKRKFVNIGKIFTLVFCAVALGLTFTLADLFSSLITVGGFTFTNSDISIPKYTLYAVCTASASTNSSAEQQSSLCKSQGGAGYIYLTNNSFNIVASMYENEADAEKVVSNLKENNIDSNILNIEIPSISFNSSLTTQEKTTLEESITIFKTCYKKLYDLSISLDTGVMNEVNIKLSINQLSSDIKAVCNNFNTVFDSQINNKLLNIKLKLDELYNKMDSLINYTTSLPLTSQIKNTYCCSIFLLKELASALS